VRCPSGAGRLAVVKRTREIPLRSFHFVQPFLALLRVAKSSETRSGLLDMRGHFVSPNGGRPQWLGKSPRCTVVAKGPAKKKQSWKKS
jgi:hypothetical protein